MIVDYEGRIMVQADPGPGEKIVVSTIDVGGLRQERDHRLGHLGLAHLRSEAYPMYRDTFFPPARYSLGADRTYESNVKAIEQVKGRLEADRSDTG